MLRHAVDLLRRAIDWHQNASGSSHPERKPQRSANRRIGLGQLCGSSSDRQRRAIADSKEVGRSGDDEPPGRRFPRPALEPDVTSRRMENGLWAYNSALRASVHTCSQTNLQQLRGSNDAILLFAVDRFRCLRHNLHRQRMALPPPAQPQLRSSDTNA